MAAALPDPWENTNKKCTVIPSLHLAGLSL